MKRNGSGLEQSPIHLLHRAGQGAENMFNAEMKLDGVTPRQLAVLMTVALHDGLSQTEIVGYTGIDRSTMTDLVRRLKKKKLLQRRRSPSDQRAYIIALTDRGHQVLRTAEPMAKRIDERILDALPDQRRQEFLAALQTIVTILQSSSSRDGSPILR